MVYGKVKGKDPYAQGSGSESGLLGAGKIKVRTENSIKGRSKLRVGENIEQGRSREIRST